MLCGSVGCVQCVRIRRLWSPWYVVVGAALYTLVCSACQLSSPSSFRRRAAYVACPAKFVAFSSAVGRALVTGFFG